MSDRKTDTIRIGDGVNYAKVATRSAEFHRDNDLCDIATVYEFKDGYALFSATVTTKKGSFSGHSLGKLGPQKAFEKLETIAVGRALAFAGYLASGDIATYEEMAEVVTASQLNSLKIKYATVHAESLEGLDRVQKLERFNAWCKSLVGEQADYSDPGSWEAAWFRMCWQDLVGPDVDVPFEA